MTVPPPPSSPPPSVLATSATSGASGAPAHAPTSGMAGASAHPAAPILGIDLGTTNSCLAVVEGGEPTIIDAAEGGRTTPSVVALTRSGERLVGQLARRQAITNPTQTLSSLKRLMGRRYDDPAVQRAAALLPYALVPSPTGDAWVQWGERAYAPPQLAAVLLAKLKADAEARLGVAVTQAVITVPAYFDAAQRQATADAGRIAGLEVRRIINEPTAAALAYGYGRARTRAHAAHAAHAARTRAQASAQAHPEPTAPAVGEGAAAAETEAEGAAAEVEEEQTIAVYDLGGGTFDISILHLAAGVFEVKSTCGDPHLGGDDFDAALMRWLLAEFHHQHGLDLSSDPIAVQRLKDAAEKAKIELSSLLATEIHLPFLALGPDGAGPLHLITTLTRAKFEGLVAPLIAATAGPCRQALAEAELSAPQIDAVLLVGGQTRMPAVQALVAQLFGRAPSKQVNPDEVVAAGAAIQGAALAGQLAGPGTGADSGTGSGAGEGPGAGAGHGGVLLLDVTPLTLGVETQGGAVAALIPRNTPIPVKRSEVFTTALDGQGTVEVHVVQGERPLAAQNTSLARFALEGLDPRAGRGVPQIEVAFVLDANGVLAVSAQDAGSGQAQAVTVQPTSGLSAEEVARMVAEAAAYGAADAARVAGLALRNGADALLYQVARLVDADREGEGTAERDRAGAQGASAGDQGAGAAAGGRGTGPGGPVGDVEREVLGTLAAALEAALPTGDAAQIRERLTRLQDTLDEIRLQGSVIPTGELPRYEALG